MFLLTKTPRPNSSSALSKSASLSDVAISTYNGIAMRSRNRCLVGDSYVLCGEYG
ncbi:hypothetical protein ALC56_11108 [Trachymyrmex septentrionalis]|uniref:Uncharacterized protein n=1 Tax=Trachymyrmex septentrionalis TaxID=34720 RepID=A0A195F216_9HYME|nr:hypothetical protein ALC56_11108 [Trachymyrmex septentrionalis]